MKSLRQIGFSFAFIFAILGAINWGSIGFLQFDCIAWVFKGIGVSLKVAYGLVGISGLFLFFNIARLLKRI